MKTKLLMVAGLVVLSFSAVQAQVCENRVQIALCSGESRVLEVQNYLTGSVFTWKKNGTVLSGSTANTLEVKETVTSAVNYEYTCEVRLNGNRLETNIFNVSIQPSTVPLIKAVDLCEGNLATIVLENAAGFREILWTIDNTYKSSKDSVTYLCRNKPIDVRLSVVNQNGCSSADQKSFQVNLNPRLWIEKTRGITDSLFMDNVACGNSRAVYVLRGLKPGIKLEGWKLYSDNTEVKLSNKQFVQEYEVRDSTLKITWAKTNTTYNLLVRAVISGGGCFFDSEYATLLIKDYSPEVDTLIRKPTSSNVLIFPSGQNKKGMNYYWGVTINGKDYAASRENRFYTLIPKGINPAYTYWVETWYSANKFCRTRTLLDQGK